MSFQNRQQTSHTLRTVGLVSLILASLSRWFLHPNASFGPDLVDATIGLLYGISIASLLLSLRRGNSACSRDEA